MYETRSKNSSMYSMRTSVDNQYKVKQQKLQMPVLRRQSKKGKSKLNLGDYILDKLYQIEKRKDDICFMVIVLTACVVGWQVLRGLL
ncbi:MAG: hypothetical protein ACOX7H_06385 [Bacillota bacterium]|jgi:hypothetical protein